MANTCTFNGQWMGEVGVLLNTCTHNGYNCVGLVGKVGILMNTCTYIMDIIVLDWWGKVGILMNTCTYNKQ